ncbi:hypothetical protein, partial [Mesorhizobium sp. M5C.F.Ca.IN.020.32.2.1]|uniref:hypothetical protein n=1 Tax=Mesorhizobium sp. M5C.F.Ca.IN.020.32.2.1 TaxID=2496771 RepID=UPI0019D43E20
MLLNFREPFLGPADRSLNPRLHVLKDLDLILETLHINIVDGHFIPPSMPRSIVSGRYASQT